MKPRNVIRLAIITAVMSTMIIICIIGIWFMWGDVFHPPDLQPEWMDIDIIMVEDNPDIIQISENTILWRIKNDTSLTGNITFQLVRRGGSTATTTSQCAVTRIGTYMNRSGDVFDIVRMANWLMPDGNTVNMSASHQANHSGLYNYTLEMEVSEAALEQMADFHSACLETAVEVRCLDTNHYGDEIYFTIIIQKWDGAP